MLYPIKFEPIIKEKVWGGKKLSLMLDKKTLSEHAGESWEISGVKGNLSVVSNGEFKGKSVIDLIKEFKDDFLGKKNYRIYGDLFPLLIKFIDADDDLSVQVHPNDETAQIRHNENGKTEIWYIIDADNDSDLILGVNEDISKEEYVNAVDSGNLQNVLNSVKVSAGDVAYIPAGRIHAIRKGVFLAEIQQTSDLTYRIYDWDRKDLDGNYRQLHTDLAVDVVDLKKSDNYLINYEICSNKFSNLISNEFFTVNISEVDTAIKKDYSEIDSFVILMNVSGNYKLVYKNGLINVSKGETILIPASLNEIEIVPQTKTKILEVYI